MGSTELRPLGIPAVRDRVVQTALRAVLEPIFEREFAEQSYGFRPKRGALDALERVENLLRSGYRWIVDADLKSYFDTIPHGRLMERAREKIADGKVLKLLEQYLQAGVMDSHKGWQATEQGTPQGAGLRLHPTKTRIVNAAVKGGFDFLGYHFEQYGCDGGKKWPRDKSQFKLRENLRAKLSRSRPGSVAQIAAELNRTLHGWFNYFKWSQPTGLQRVDEWTRERIRHILRRRHKRRGMVRGRERTEYPIHWFTEQRLFNLTMAQARWLQSLAGTH